eukprot:TRINITY_DN891_c0_g1_i2.p1 TRINITY_DN891_c0_g1~~TRINITY_DN891_c0_g1_i2.p1  ORF type:complete len:269 (+),score=47.93 TRINITY_DN891_c0_g1_i2:593-1399(+)
MFSVLLSGGESGGDEGLNLIEINFHGLSENLFYILMFILIVTLMRVLFHHIDIKSVPESSMVIIVGVLFGLIGYAISGGDQNASDASLQIFNFNNDVFFLILIPPIIFDAGFFLQKNFFFNNLGTILLYAVVGTIFNAASIGNTIILFPVLPFSKPHVFHVPWKLVNTFCFSVSSKSRMKKQTKTTQPFPFVRCNNLGSVLCWRYQHTIVSGRIAPFWISDLCRGSSRRKCLKCLHSLCFFNTCITTVESEQLLAVLQRKHPTQRAPF